MGGGPAARTGSSIISFHFSRPFQFLPSFFRYFAFFQGVRNLLVLLLRLTLAAAAPLPGYLNRPMAPKAEYYPI